MYRIFCESYKNFLEIFKNDGKNDYRLQISEPFELITNKDKYYDEKMKNTKKYKRTSSLLYEMEKNINRYPQFKAFLWTLESRNIKGKKYNCESKEELEEQMKLANSFLKLAYWY